MGSGGWMRRVVRRLGIGVVALFLLATAASLSYNLATAGRDVSARALYAGPYVRVDGSLLAYRHWGSHGSPIVLIGGFIEPSWVWHAVGPLLGRDHRVYALDLPPFGYSERAGPYTISHWTALVRSFVRRLRLQRPLVVGHSLGAAVAVSYAVGSKPDTRGIVLLDGDALPGGGAAGWLHVLLVPPWYTTLYRIATNWSWLFRRGLASAWGSGRPPFSAGFIAEWQRPFRVRGTAAALASMVGQGVPGVSVPTLRRVRVPRVVVWGARDRVDSVAAGRRTAALLRCRFVAIPAAGHLSMLQEPRAVARLIAAADQRFGAATSQALGR